MPSLGSSFCLQAGSTQASCQGRRNARSAHAPGSGASEIGTCAGTYIRYPHADDALWKGCKQLRRAVTAGNARAARGLEARAEARR
jgi:hypothetical protein